MHDDQPLPVPPAALRRRVIASLRAEGVVRRPVPWSRVPLAIAAGLLLFLAGMLVPRSGGREAVGQPGFVLLLYEDAAFRPALPTEELVREYTEWGAALEREGRLVLAEELDAAGAVLGDAAASEVEPLGRLTGMYVVQARDAAAARQLAAGHPHLRHGGRIVVRAFVQHG